MLSAMQKDERLTSLPLLLSLSLYIFLSLPPHSSGRRLATVASPFLGRLLPSWACRLVVVAAILNGIDFVALPALSPGALPPLPREHRHALLSIRLRSRCLGHVLSGRRQEQRRRKGARGVFVKKNLTSF